MKKRIPNSVFLGLSLIALVILTTVTNLTLTQSFAIIYFVFTSLRFLNNLGHTICIFDFLTFYSALDTLLSPLISYLFYGRDNHLALIWGRYMRVDEDVYFGYLIPANIALFIGLHYTFNKNTQQALAYLKRAKEYVSDKLRVGIVFVVVGTIAGIFANVVTPSLTYIFYLFSMLLYVGGFYIYFSVKKRRNLVITTIIVLFFAEAVMSGLFGEFFMFIILAACVILPQYKFRFISKLAFFCFGIFIVLNIQNVKSEYRYLTWGGAKENSLQYRNQSNLEIFSDLFVDRVTHSDKILDEKSIFFLNTRFNQGWLISLAMNYVPRVEPYAYGQTIALSLAAVAVPRFLWPEKPEAGGYLNLSRFVGIKKRLTYSMNIGPYGEGYGNFGPVGGVIFIFFYAMLIGWFLHKTLDLAKKYPSLIVWIPLMFYYVLTVETDILTTINSFVKVAAFIYFIYWFARKAYRLNI